MFWALLCTWRLELNRCKAAGVVPRTKLGKSTQNKQEPHMHSGVIVKSENLSEKLPDSFSFLVFGVKISCEKIPARANHLSNHKLLSFIWGPWKIALIFLVSETYTAPWTRAGLPGLLRVSNRLSAKKEPWGWHEEGKSVCFHHTLAWQ